MKYMLLLRHDPALSPEEGTAEHDAEMARWGQVMGELTESGAFVDAKGLDSEETATTVRSRDDETIITDGPFAETKEQFFSYIVIDVADIDTAIGWAKKMPNVTSGSVEVRPLSVHEQDT